MGPTVTRTLPAIILAVKSVEIDIRTRDGDPKTRPRITDNTWAPLQSIKRPFQKFAQNRWPHPPPRFHPTVRFMLRL